MTTPVTQPLNLNPDGGSKVNELISQLRALESAISVAEFGHGETLAALQGELARTSAKGSTTAFLVQGYGGSIERFANAARSGSSLPGDPEAIRFFVEESNAALARWSVVRHQLDTVQTRLGEANALHRDRVTALQDEWTRCLEALAGHVSRPVPTDASSAAGAARHPSVSPKTGRVDDWDDLPAFYGSSAPTERTCAHCGRELRRGKRRFCSRNCMQMHREVFGTPHMPRVEDEG